MIIYLNNTHGGVLLVDVNDNECEECFSERLGHILAAIHPLNCFNA